VLSDQSLAACLLALVAAAAVLFLRHPSGGGRPALLASWALTPGVVSPDVTPANVDRTICVPGWSRSIRPPSDYTSRLKLEQMRTLGLSGRAADYQEDHLISLELGGHPTDPRNLWPEPYPRASAVDRIENELHAKVCDGSLDLRGAQRQESLLKHTNG
jgi:hypothetical protein